MADPYIKQLAREALAQSAVNPAGAFSRSILGTQQLQRPADPYLRQQYPAVFGGLAGLAGMAPDEMGGSVLDPNTVRVREAQAMTYPIGTALQMLPAAQITKGLPVGMSIKSVDDLVTKYPNVKIDASLNKNEINLSRIVVPKEMRNQGIGTQVMNDLSEYADSIGKRITLTPSSDFGGNVSKLKSFYKELGFVENKGRNKDFSTKETMYREPKPLDQPPQFQEPVQQAMQEFEQGLTNFMATR